LIRYFENGRFSTRNFMSRLATFVLSTLLLVPDVNAQTRVTAQPQVSVQPSKVAPPVGASTPSPAAPLVAPLADYGLGGGDQVQLDIPALGDEFTSEKIFRIDASGDLGLPVIGHVQALGLTVAQLEEAIKVQLKRIVKDPDVIVTVVGFGSQPVSVLGSVMRPGIVQIGGSKNLFEVLSMAGGLSDDAGYLVTITRDMKWGPLPLADAHTDATGQFSVGSVRIKDLLSSSNTTENILILPNDKISVPTSELVYAVGTVIKPGGFLLNQHQSLSALQVVSLAEGFTKTAKPQRAMILRVVKGSPNRQQIPVNLKALVAGKIPDIQLQAEDILFVPNSGAKSAGYSALEALTGATGALIYTAGH
jgi:polysaccharide export outer membrane protein